MIKDAVMTSHDSDQLGVVIGMAALFLSTSGVVLSILAVFTTSLFPAIQFRQPVLLVKPKGFIRTKKARATPRAPLTVRTTSKVSLQSLTISNGQMPRPQADGRRVSFNLECTEIFTISEARKTRRTSASSVFPVAQLKNFVAASMDRTALSLVPSSKTQSVASNIDHVPSAPGCDGKCGCKPRKLSISSASDTAVSLEGCKQFAARSSLTLGKRLSTVKKAFKGQGKESTNVSDPDPDDGIPFGSSALSPILPEAKGLGNTMQQAPSRRSRFSLRSKRPKHQTDGDESANSAKKETRHRRAFSDAFTAMRKRALSGSAHPPLTASTLAQLGERETWVAWHLRKKAGRPDTPNSDVSAKSTSSRFVNRIRKWTHNVDPEDVLRTPVADGDAVSTPCGIRLPRPSFAQVESDSTLDVLDSRLARAKITQERRGLGLSHVTQLEGVIEEEHPRADLPKISCASESISRSTSLKPAMRKRSFSDSYVTAHRNEYQFA